MVRAARRAAVRIEGSILETFGGLFEASSHAFHSPKFALGLAKVAGRSYAEALRLTMPARCVCSQIARSCAPNFAPTRDFSDPSNKLTDRPPSLAKATAPKISVNEYRGGNAPRATTALVEGDFPTPPMAWGRGSPRSPSTPSPRQQQRGTGNLKTTSDLNRPRPARASATPSPRGRPCRRPST